MKDWRRVNENTHPNLICIHEWYIPDHKKLVSAYTSVTYATNTLRMMFVTYATDGRWYLVFAAFNGQSGTELGRKEKGRSPPLLTKNHAIYI
jgi:hypothetical protein